VIVRKIVRCGGALEVGVLEGRRKSRLLGVGLPHVLVGIPEEHVKNVKNVVDRRAIPLKTSDKSDEGHPSLDSYHHHPLFFRVSALWSRVLPLRLHTATIISRLISENFRFHLASLAIGSLGMESGGRCFNCVVATTACIAEYLTEK
jgi:hypothetical protein